MAEKGRVKSLSGTAVSKDVNGRERLLKEGDVVFSGEMIQFSEKAGTHILILMQGGKEFELEAGQSVRLRGEAPVDESYDAQAVLKELLALDEVRNSEEYHKSRAGFNQTLGRFEQNTQASQKDSQEQSSLSQGLGASLAPAQIYSAPAKPAPQVPASSYAPLKIAAAF